MQAEIVKQQLKEVGIDVKVSAGIKFFDALGKGDFDMAIVGWLGFVDPDEFPATFSSTKTRGIKQGYSNEEVDALEQGRMTTRRSVRGCSHRAQKIIAEEAPMVFLYGTSGRQP